MALDAWLPVGFRLPDGSAAHVALFEDINWQIFETRGNGRALLAHDELAQRWLSVGLIENGQFSPLDFGDRRIWSISCDPGQVLCPVAGGKSPDTNAEALSFALAFSASRAIDHESPLQYALYVEKISRLLPTYSISSQMNDDVVLGYWLTGGVSVSVKSFRRLRKTMSWLGGDHLKNVIQAAGFNVEEIISEEKRQTDPSQVSAAPLERTGQQRVRASETGTLKIFELAGRAKLTDFFNEYVIDIIRNPGKYKMLGISFPSAIVLHGPPGCGKTFAVDRLINFLGWPSFQIDASSVASPYIHETSKKVAQIFDKAMQNAPSVLVIDEMETFLAHREIESGHHRVEEVAEFLRRIPEAAKNNVLIIAMTNRIELIDSAILRRGRFDHVIKVDYANEIEVLSLLDEFLSKLPSSDDVNLKSFAYKLAGCPLSDVAFVMREGARLAVRAGKDELDQESLNIAMNSLQKCDGGAKPRIGFI